MTENTVKPVIFAFSLETVLVPGKKCLQHNVFVWPERDCGEEIPNIGTKKFLGVIAYSQRRSIEEIDSKELWIPGRVSLSAYKSNVDSVWKTFFSFLREQERQAMRLPRWLENSHKYCPVSVSGIGYFHKFQAREGSELVACFPDIDEIYSDMPDLKSYSKVFENHRNSRAK